MNELRGSFRPEFLNRLDEIIMFKPLSKADVNAIMDLQITQINERIADKEISIRLTDAAKELIVNEAYDGVYGARPLKRYLQKNVETLAAKMMLADMVDVTDTIVIDAKDGRLDGTVEHNDNEC